MPRCATPLISFTNEGLDWHIWRTGKFWLASLPNNGRLYLRFPRIDLSFIRCPNKVDLMILKTVLRASRELKSQTIECRINDILWQLNLKSRDRRRLRQSLCMWSHLAIVDERNHIILSPALTFFRTSTKLRIRINQEWLAPDALCF
jgi:hypothetical protein